MVTGGAQGIGAGIATVLAEYGAKVAIIDVQDEKASEHAVAIGGVAISADLMTQSGCQQAVDDTLAACGGIDIIVNNAAPGRNRSLLYDIGDIDWNAHADLVINAVTRLVDAARPHLNPGAAIVNVSSVAGQTVMVDHCNWPYHVSKAGLDQLTRYLACLLGPSGIRVNGVAPTLVDRDVGRKLSDDADANRVIKATVPLGRAGSARDIGNAVAFLSSDAASYITGQVLTVDGGIGVREIFGAGLSALIRE